MRPLLLAALAVLASWLCFHSWFEARASTVEKLGLAQLVERAEWVIEGRVLETRAQSDVRGRPETEIRLAVERTFAGHVAGEALFRFPGGRLASEGRGLILPGLPSLKVGERVILCLTRESRTGHRLPVGLAQGKWRVVVQGGSKLAVRDQAGLEFLDVHSGALLPAEELASFDYATLVGELERLCRVQRRAASGGK